MLSYPLFSAAFYYANDPASPYVMCAGDSLDDVRAQVRIMERTLPLPKRVEIYDTYTLDHIETLHPTCPIIP